ncbi:MULTISPECIES: IclR family transcriptional regulator [Bacillaceae]|uniref:Glycerol operon regulatory protein n=1 Tax=Domibacillus aminovorans TaxID=29332 RepID=A0A177L1Z1_9BACI|nr:MULTISPECIES: IclR family transcriptional regulator [Bacillaceae]OAH59648.1 IclR family transcriptional regulator [Domibacillus aminovorans]
MSERLIQSIERAADVLELFLTSKSELSVKEISQKLNLSKSTVHGIIKTLEHRGYLQQNPDDLKYKLGIKLFELGNLVGKNLEIGKIARPIIRDLVVELNETVHLVTLQRDEVIYIEKVEGPRALTIYSHIGKRAPFHCTGVGKAILAYLSEKEVDRILSSVILESFTEYTMTNREDIKNHLHSIREKGYAVDDEEIELGLKCIAAPIFDHQGNVIASISCAAPKMRLDENRLPKVIEGIKRAASEISTYLGYKDDIHLN